MVSRTLTIVRRGRIGGRIMDEMQHSGLPSPRDESATTHQGQRFIGGLLGGLAIGVASLLVVRPARQPEAITHEFVSMSEYEIGAGSAWGVGG